MTDAWRVDALAHAMRDLDKRREACGLVVIRKGREIYWPCKNVSPYERMFEIAPDDFAAAEDEGDIIRVVHSHCYIKPTPSEVDLVACEQTKLPWSIVSVPNGEWFDFVPSGYKAPLVGRQWAHGMLDCYSLIRDAYREELGVELMDFEREDQWWHKGGNLYADNFARAGFHQVPIKEAKPYDMIVMQLGSPVMNHGALYRGNDRMLHHVYRRLSCHDVWSGFYYKNTIKVMRHETQL